MDQVQPDLHLTVSPHELDIVMRCLIEQPYKVVSGIIAKLVNQANSGQPAQAASTAPVALVSDLLATAQSAVSGVTGILPLAGAGLHVPEGIAGLSGVASAVQGLVGDALHILP